MSIKGKAMKEMYTINKPSVNYRELTSLNSSMLKLFDSDPVKFFEEFKLGKKRKNKSSISLALGDIIDFYLLDCRGDENEFNNRYDEKFALFDGVKNTGQVFLLAETLFEITQDETNAEGTITTEFSTRFKQGYQRLVDMGKYGGKTEEKALEDFNKNGYAYFQELLKNQGKHIVDMVSLSKGKKMVSILLEDDFTKEIFEEDDKTEYFPKFPIEWEYECKGRNIKCKSEIDILRIDYSKKKVFLKDLKTTYDNENFEYTYIKYGYYLQAAFYYLAVKQWMLMEGLRDYKLVPMEFIVADTSSNNRRPIRYQTSEDDLEKSLNGFILKGVRYKGVNEIVEEILWAEDNDMWNCSKTLFDNDGILPLNLQYEQ